MIRRFRALALVAAAAPLFAACQDSLDNQTVGKKPTPAGGAIFARYAVLGTSLGAGIQSGGINDSTQRESYSAQLARAMGLTPGADWRYPSFKYPGCPAPYTNPITGARVGGASASACALRTPSSATEFMNNTSIPAMRIEQALDVGDTTGVLGVLSLSQFITGGMNPMDVVEAQAPTFVTVELGANDILGAAGAGDATQLTSQANFDAALTEIADRLDALHLEGVAIANIPTNIPHFTYGQVFFCLKTGLCPGVPANPLFTNMTVDASCAPAPGVGGSYLLPFPATGMIVGVLAGGGLASMNCGTDVVTVTTGAGTAPVSPTISTTEYATIFGRLQAFNTSIKNLATARGYAFVNLDSTLNAAANAAQIPPFPFTPAGTVSFGPLFSLDGLHWSKAGGRVIATAFANAINAKYSTTITVP